MIALILNIVLPEDQEKGLQNKIVESIREKA